MQDPYLLTAPETKARFREIYRKADAVVEVLLIVHFLFGVGISFFYDTWFIGFGVGSWCLLSYFLSKRLWPNSDFYQYVLSVNTVLMSAAYIYQLHGMPEMHYWLFINSTILIIYQNWKLQIPLLGLSLIHYVLFAYLQQAGYEDIYFTPQDKMDGTALLFHGALAAAVCFISGVWGHNLRQRTLQDGYNLKKMSEQQEELLQSSESMQLMNAYLRETNQRMLHTNEELKASEEQLQASERELTRLNGHLNELVSERTATLRRQNLKLLQYAFINAHKVRSPLARIIGLVNLIEYEQLLDAQATEVMNHLFRSARELDAILNEVKESLEEGEFKE